MATGSSRRRIRERVSAAAEDALAETDVVSALDVFLRMEWLKPSKVAAWRQGRVEYLAKAMKAKPDDVRVALQFLADWAEARKLDGSDVEYLSQSLEPRPLRFLPPEDSAGLEGAFRARWIARHVSEKKRESLEAKQAKAPDVVAIMPLNEDWTCGRCGQVGGELLVMDATTKGPTCLSCAGLSELVFLPAGDTNLTRLARVHSSRNLFVIRFNLRRKRYERKGVLVEEDAVERARRDVDE